MKIAYVAHTRYPTEKAHGLQVTRVCEAMTALSHTVTLVAPGVHNEVQEDFATYYNVQHPFVVTHLPTKDALLSPVIPGRFAMMFTMQSYRRALCSYFKNEQFDLLYARSPHILPALLHTGIPVVLELHTLPRSGHKKFVDQCKKCSRVVCLTAPMKDQLAKWGVPADHIIVEGDAVDITRFAALDARMFSLSTSKPIVGYIGSLTTMDHLEKGVDLLIRSAAMERNFFTFVVGGPDIMVQKYTELASSLGLTDSDIHFEGRVPAADVPAAIRKCDICVYPAPKSNHTFFTRDTSPLKLFEYLAAGVPIVCADIPPVRDVVDEQSVWFFEPGNAQSLAQAISRTLNNADESAQKTLLGKDIAAHHTWEKRMGRIIEALSL